MQHQPPLSRPLDEEEDLDLVAIWLRCDPVRWLAGALGGAFAGVAAIAVAMLLAVRSGTEFWFPVKIGALPILGSGATEYGLRLPAILVGFAMIEGICMFWGIMYAHFTGTNRIKALLPMGAVFGIFSWVFIFNLFAQSFTTINALQLSRGAGLLIMLIYGISLTTVAFFDRIVRGRPL